MTSPAPASRPAVLRGEELHLAYERAAVVHGVDVRLHPGEVTALVGPNGSGKSTVLRALARLHRAQRGRVGLAVAVGGEGPDGADGTGEVDALDLHPKAFARRVTLLSQSRPTPGGVTVAEVVAYGRHPHRARWTGADPDGAAAVARAMAITGVTDMAERGVGELSGGELQRVWLATCLAQDTEVLLLDEPTNHLDLRYQHEVLDLVLDLADAGVAVGVVLHDLQHAATVADHCVLLHRGRVHAAGPPEEVLTPEALTAVYGIRVDVVRDPVDGALTLRPVGRRSGRRPSRADAAPLPVTT